MSVKDRVASMLTLISAICDKFGPRPAGSPDERKAAAYLREHLGQFCDEVALDHFSIYPRFYPQGFVKIAGYLIIGASILALGPLITTIAGLIALLFALVIVFVSLFLMKLGFARLFRFSTGESQNVLGHVPPQGVANPTGTAAVARKQLIIAGHMDSAYEMPVAKFGHRYLLLGAVYLVVLLAVLGVKIAAFGSWWAPAALLSSASGVVFFSSVDFAPLGLFIMLFPSFWKLIRGVTGGEPVQGANDNLSGVAIAVALGEYFAQPAHRLQNIGLWVGAFGAEEIGERGAYAFVQQHLSDVGKFPDPIAIIPESVGAGRQIKVVLEEKMHFAHHNVALSSRIVEGFNEYAKHKMEESPLNPNFQEISCELARLPFAGSDAGRFAHAGVPSAVIMAFDATGKPPHYHLQSDIPANISAVTMETVFGALRECITQMDKDIDLSQRLEL